MSRCVRAKSPLRLGLAGGGTDVSPYSELYGGQVLNATISLFTYCNITPADDGFCEFYAGDADLRERVPADAAMPVDGTLMLHRAVYRRMTSDFLAGSAPAVRVTTFSDAPPGSGVGSSSSLVVAMVQAFAEYFDIALGEYDLAHLAFQIERVDCGLAGGKQDHYAAAFGGFNFIEFGATDRVIVNPLRIKPEVVNDLEAGLLLYYTGRSRDSARIIDAQIRATADADSPALLAMHQLKASALVMKEALLRGRVQEVLAGLGRGWDVKKQAASAISNPFLEEIAEAAFALGASGLKVSGAGGGGFMMITVGPERRFALMRGFEHFGGRFYPFSFTERGAQSWKAA